MALPQGPCWKLAGRMLLLAALAAGSAGAGRAQAVDEGGPIQRSPDQTQPKAITNDSIIRMVKAELDPSIILQTIRSQPAKYDLSPDGLIALKTAGVSDDIIAAMQAREAGLAVRQVEAKAPVGTPVAGMPTDIGAYYKDSNGEWVPLRTERVIFRSAGRIKSAVTYGIVKEDMNGRMEGPHSTLKLKPGMEVLIYTPSGTEGAEYDFLRLRDYKDHREFRTLTGGILHSESGSNRDSLEFDPKRIASRTYTFTVPKDIVKGEYGLLPPGAANQRGFADTGKIYTFSIPE